MSERKEIGKIKLVVLGFTGYQDAGFGFRFNLGGKNWEVTDDIHWVWNEEPKKGLHKWTKKDQLDGMSKAMEFVRKKMNEANVDNFNDLVDVPVEVTFEDHTLKSWRILTEVL